MIIQLFWQYHIFSLQFTKFPSNFRQCRSNFHKNLGAVGTKNCGNNRFVTTNGFRPMKTRTPIYIIVYTLRHENKILHPAQETLLYELGNEGSDAILNLIMFSWDMRHPFFPDQTIFDFPTSIFNHFHNKSFLHSKAHITYKFCALCPKIAAL